MKTIELDLKRVAANLEEVVDGLRTDRAYALLKSGGTVVAELMPLNRDEVPRCRAHEIEWVGPRVVPSEISGHSVVAARPGVRKVTSEEIYEMLRGAYE